MERFVDDQLMETEVFDYRERLYDGGELKGMLALAGFDEIHVTKAYQANTQPIDRDGIVFSCQRN